MKQKNFVHLLKLFMSQYQEKRLLHEKLLLHFPSKTPYYNL